MGEHLAVLPDRSVQSLDVLAELRAAIGKLDVQRQGLADAGEWDRLVYGLDGLRVLIADLQILCRAVEDDAVRLLPHKREVLDGVVAERRSGTQRKEWDDDGIVREIVNKAEFDHPLELAQEILKAAGVGYWRVTQLRALGIRVDDYCDKVDGRATLQLTKAS